MKDKDNIDSENRTELIASRVSKTEKEVIEKFIEEYNEKNDTNLNKTEFIRTAIFTHMYHLENSDYILDVDFFDKSINVINSNIKKVKDVINDLEKKLLGVTKHIKTLHINDLIRKVKEENIKSM